MPDLLDCPASVDDLYLARGADVSRWRPIMNGDVFHEVEIPGLPAAPFTMVVAHPCTMRTGARLKPRLRCCPVVDHAEIPFARWAGGHFRVMPLPHLDGDRHHVVRLDETGMVPIDALGLERRVACLETHGMLLLLQRMVFNDSRVAVPLARFHEQVAGVVQEAELLEEWNETLAAGRVEAGESLADALGAEAETFDALLARPRGSGTLRDGLAGPGVHATRRLVQQEIDARRR